MQGKQPRFTRRLLLMMMDAQGLPFVGRAASFLLTRAPVVSVAYANLRAEEKMREVLDRVQAQMDADLERERQEQAASPDYAALLADVADAATRFLELAGPHLAKIEGEGDWQQVLDANMAVAFALERAVVALVRSTQAQGNLASEPPGSCAEQAVKRIIEDYSYPYFYHHQARLFGVCQGNNAAGHWSFCCWPLHFKRPEGETHLPVPQGCYGLTEEQRLYLHNWHSAYKCRNGVATCLEIPALSPLAWDDEDEALATMEDYDINADLLRETAGEERRYSADEDELIFDAADWLQGEDE